MIFLYKGIFQGWGVKFSKVFKGWGLLIRMGGLTDLEFGGAR